MHIDDSFRGKHTCLEPVKSYLAGVFNYLRLNKKIPPRVRAIDMRHILLLLPFLFDGLLADEVLEHNWSHPLNPVLDPSSELIGITILFIEWYNLYRRRFPPKEQVDLQDLTSVGESCEHIYHILHSLHILYVLLTYVLIEGTWNSVG